MTDLTTWRKEPGARIAPSRDLDRGKVQAPCIVRAPEGGYRLFYTAVGPAKPFAACQGYILSAVSRDGLAFDPEPGLRVAPQPELPHLSLRALAPTIVTRAGGAWRMYFEARGSADRPTVICSAVSDDQLDWRLEAGIRLEDPGSLGAPRARILADGTVQLVVFRRDAEGTAIVSTASADGVTFAGEPLILLRDRTSAIDSAGLTAAEVVPPGGPGEPWVMLLSAWQDRPAGSPPPPLHPSQDADAVASGRSADFASASIAADMSGYRSRILVAASLDGEHWKRGPVVVEGDGYGGHDIDAVHAEDMSVIALGDGRHRMYYAACDAHGVWRIASAISG